MTQRFQLALNVENLETAIEYYGKLVSDYRQPLFQYTHLLGDR